MITGIAHSAFIVRDMEKTLDFYVNKLGLKHAFSLADESGKPWIEYVKVCDGQFLEFFYANGSTPENTAGSFMHICLQVDDAQKTCERLMANGVTMDVLPRTGSDKNTQFWSKDPDGYAIEFMQISDESPQANA